jgi:pimeloyl-ACP methyl ester carboxylesterase
VSNQEGRRPPRAPAAYLGDDSGVMPRGEPSGKSTVVLVHALGSSRRAWTPQVQALSDHHRVLVPDLPGHGDARGPFTLDRAVESVHITINQAAGDSHLVGISVGAVVALLACLERPGEAASLVLSGGLAHAPRWIVLQRVIAGITPEPLLVRGLARMYSGGRAEYADQAVEDLRRCGKRTYLSALRELATIDLRPRLGQVAVPTLVLCGSKDRSNVPMSRELAAGIPAAELQIVQGATHLWNLQQPELFNRTVAAFLEQVGSDEP